MNDAQIALLTIEVCRALDYWYVTDAFGNKNENKVPEQDLNIMSRGWNAFLQHVLPRLGTVPALLHKLAEGQSFPFARQTYPVTSVIGVPRAVKPFRTATRTWNSAT